MFSWLTAGCTRRPHSDFVRLTYTYYLAHPNTQYGECMRKEGSGYFAHFIISDNFFIAADISIQKADISMWKNKLNSYRLVSDAL